MDFVLLAPPVESRLFLSLMYVATKTRPDIPATLKAEDKSKVGRDISI
jgi:hypothetical protein